MGAIRFTLDEKILQFFKQHLPLEIFVETGTYEGDNLLLAEKYFKACFSVELNDEHFAEAQQAFKDKENIFIEHGDSKELLASIKEHVQEACTVFWLDAHDICNAINPDIEPTDAQSPILGELNAIERLNENSVLMIDDAHLYLNTLPKPNSLSRWTDFHDILLALLKMSDQHRITVYDDTIVFYPEKLRFAFTQFCYENAVDLLDVMLDARSYRESKKQSSDEVKESGAFFKKFRKR